MMVAFLQSSRAKRFIIYPLITLFIWHFIFSNFPDFFLVKITVGMIQLVWPKNINLGIPMAVYKLIFGYLLGYVYGTISLFIKVRQFRRPLSFLVVLYLKYVVSMLLTCLFGFVFFLELMLYPLFKFIIRRAKKKNQLSESQRFYKELEKIIES